jgi:hypothetical protein
MLKNCVKRGNYLTQRRQERKGLIFLFFLAVFAPWREIFLVVALPPKVKSSIVAGETDEI